MIIVRHISNEQIPLVEKFDIVNLDALTKALNMILFRNEDMNEVLTKTLNKFGIKFVIEEKLDKVPVDGYSFWEGDNPTIVLTKRHDRIDNFGFTLMHELGHICLHLINDKSKEYIETENAQKKRKQEKKRKLICSHLNIFGETFHTKNCLGEYTNLMLRPIILLLYLKIILSM